MRILEGSQNPFAGWVEVDYQGVASNAILIDLPSAGSWVAVVSKLEHEPSSSAPTPAQMRSWSGAERWHLTVPGKAEISVKRQGRTIVAVRNGEQFRVELSEPPARSPVASRGDEVFAAAAAKYGSRFEDILKFRSKVTALLLALLIGHLAILLLFRRVKPDFAKALAMVAVVCWMLSGLLLHIVFPLGWL